MFAVIKTGGKQLKVAANDVVTVEKLTGNAGEKIAFNVLMLGGEAPVVGAPLVEGASVDAEIVAQTRGEKVIAFKKRRRQNSRRKRGHRQLLTQVRIVSITQNGKVLAQAEAASAAEASKPARKSSKKTDSTEASQDANEATA